MTKHLIILSCIGLLSTQCAQAQSPNTAEIYEKIKKSKELTARAAANKKAVSANSPEQQEADALTKLNEANKTGFALTRTKNYAAALPYFSQAADVILSEKFKQSRDPEKNPNVYQIVSNLDTVLAHCYQSKDWNSAENAAKKKIEIFEAANKTDSKDYQSTLKQLQIILTLENKSTGEIPEKLKRLGAAPSK